MTDTPPDDRFHSRLEGLATAIEERPPLEIETAPPTTSSRRLYWLIGGLCALTIGAAEIGILMHADRLGAPPAPPEVLAAVQADPCAPRLMQIMDAIARYRREHGGPPPTLAELQPTYLSFAPIDPVTNQPYAYAVIGESISLSCPTAQSANGGAGTASDA